MVKFYITDKKYIDVNKIVDIMSLRRLELAILKGTIQN